MRPDDLDDQPGSEGALAVEERPKTKRPRRFKVLLHNDDFTTMEFVVAVLVDYFHKSPAEATHVMLQVHHRGVGVAGVYPQEAAETKVAEVTAAARAEGMPLMLSLEEE
jgi:ATP-dependent Clp protease adaptor protein ClpS